MNGLITLMTHSGYSLNGQSDEIKPIKVNFHCCLELTHFLHLFFLIKQVLAKQVLVELIGAFLEFVAFIAFTITFVHPILFTDLRYAIASFAFFILAATIESTYFTEHFVECLRGLNLCQYNLLRSKSIGH